MPDFQLFRIKVVRASTGLFNQDMQPSAILVAALEERPTTSSGWRGYTWYVGNLQILDPNGMYFAFGRTTRRTVSQFDRQRGEFVERDFESAPYTQVVVDTNLEVCAIAKKAELAPTVDGIARNLGKVLSSARVIQNSLTETEISSLNDPGEFLSQLRNAYSITQFGLTFSRPNPWDVNEDFTKPMERLLQESAGTRGKTTLNGNQLAPGVLEELSRSAAASGDDAHARLRESPEARPVTRHLRGHFVIIGHDELDTDDKRFDLLRLLRATYARIRNQRDG